MTEANKELIELVSDADIEAVWGNANFGNSNKREIIFDTLLKTAGDFSTGATSMKICQELGLIRGHQKYRYADLTKKGRRYLYYAVKSSLTAAPEKEKP